MDEPLFGRVSLTRHAGRRTTVLVEKQALPSVGSNGTIAGFSVAMPDNTELTIRLDRAAVEALARALKIVG